MLKRQMNSSRQRPANHQVPEAIQLHFPTEWFTSSESATGQRNRMANHCTWDHKRASTVADRSIHSSRYQWFNSSVRDAEPGTSSSPCMLKKMPEAPGASRSQGHVPTPKLTRATASVHRGLQSDVEGQSSIDRRPPVTRGDAW